MQVVEIAEANPAPYDSSGTSNVEVSIISPQNKTYDTNEIELIANFGAFPGVWYIGYCLDGGPYVEIAPGHPLLHNLTETVWLNGLSKASHSIVVKATAMGGPGGQVTACSQVYFTVTKNLEPQSPSPSPATTPTPTVPEYPSWTLPLMLSVMVATAGLLVYFKKHKRRAEKI
ncbi:MAG TPA: hypothetical protein VK253_00575 [Candidatus Binatia bacterium]|nr:hypothetical protein [Candidatus Binatia bacterium]